MTMFNRIHIVIDALKLFLRSLPPNCKFSIISFGAQHTFMEINGNKIIDYNEFNVKEATIQIDKFAPDFGGTNILDPIISA